MTESAIQKDITDYLRKAGYLVIRMNAGQTAHNQKGCPAGTPDLLAIGNGGTLWIEVKTATGKVSKVQESMHDYLNLNGQTVIIARCVEDVIISATGSVSQIRR